MKSPIRSFKEIRQVEAAPMHAKIWKNRQTDMTQVASTSCDNAKGVLLGNLTVPHLFKKFPACWGTHEVNYCDQNGPPLAAILGHSNTVHAVPSDFFNIYFNIILPYTIRSFHYSFSRKFPHQNLVRVSPLPLLCHTSPSDPHLTARISCFFLHLALQYLPQRPLLELPQAGSFPCVRDQVFTPI